MVSSHSLAYGRAATCRRKQRGTGDVLLRWRLHSGLCEASALRKRGSAPPTPPFGRGAGRAAARFGGSRACTARPTCYGWPSRPCGAPAYSPSCPKMPLAGHRLRLFWSGRGALGGPPLFERPPAFWPGFGGFAPSGEAPSGLPSLRSAPPLPLRSSVPKKPGAARFARAGGASPPVRRTPPWGGLGLGSSLQVKGHANLSAALRVCHVPCLALIARRHRLRLPPALARGARGLRLNASPRLRRPPGKSPPGLLVEYLILPVAGFASCH